MKKIRAAALMAAAAATSLVAATASAAPGPNYNKADYWGPDCSKSEAQSGDMSWIADQDYSLVVVKGGAVDSGDGPGNVVYYFVTAGDELTAPLNNGGQQAAISHIIVCGPGGGGS